MKTSVTRRSRATPLQAIFIGSALFLGACAQPEERAQTYLANGQALLAKGEDAKAAVEFRNALKQKKDLVDAWRGLAEIEEKRQNWSGLAPILKSVVELAPDDLDARLRLGRLL